MVRNFNGQNKGLTQFFRGGPSKKSVTRDDLQDRHIYLQKGGSNRAHSSSSYANEEDLNRGEAVN